VGEQVPDGHAVGIDPGDVPGHWVVEREPPLIDQRQHRWGRGHHFGERGEVEQRAGGQRPLAVGAPLGRARHHPDQRPVPHTQRQCGAGHDSFPHRRLQRLVQPVVGRRHRLLAIGRELV
jgi:hypothetical protein